MDKLPSALGFLQMAKGPAALIGPPIAGKFDSPIARRLIATFRKSVSKCINNAKFAVIR